MITAIIIAVVFSGLGWVTAQREPSVAKLFVAATTICLPSTAIWWILELIDWPTSVTRMALPVAIVWVPFCLAHAIRGALVAIRVKL